MTDNTLQAPMPEANTASSTTRHFVRRFVACRLCWRVALTVLISIVVVEAAILFPSLRNYERDLLHRIEDSVTAAMAARINAHVDSPRAAVVGLSAAMANYPPLLGGQIYDSEGRQVGTFGEQPTIRITEAASLSRRERRIEDGNRFELLWPRAVSGLPFDIVARADSTWVSDELRGFILRITGLVLLISTVATSAALLVLGRSVLLPLLKLRERMSAVGADPENPEQHIVPTTRRDELGELIHHFNDLMVLVSEQHREALTRVVAMADNAVDGIVAYAPDGNLVYANRAALAYFGVASHTELEAIDWHLIPDGGDGLPVSIRDAAAYGASNGEYLLVMPDGRQRPVLCGANRLLGRNGQPTLYFASLRDITVRKAAEQALIDAKRESDLANRTKSEFLTTMSHELRTPLNAIIGFSEMIATAGLGPLGDARYRDYAVDINESGTRLLAMIEDILELSRIEAGQFELNTSSVDIATELEGALREMRDAIDEKKHTAELIIAPGLPALEGDRQAIAQIIRNLLSNAAKFTPEGGHIAVVAASSQGGGLEIAIRDNGIGIPRDALERVLEPFTQADGSLSRRYEGTGLGLALAATLTKLHNGRIDIESELGNGTTVRVTFPAELCRPLAVGKESGPEGPSRPAPH